MATKRFAQGAKLRIGDGASPEVFTAIGNVQDLQTPGSTTDLIEVTDHDSPDGSKEYLGGLSDGSEFTLTIGWDPEDSVHDDLEKRRGENANFQMELNNKISSHGTMYDYNAVIRAFVGKAPVNGQHTADITLKVSGKVIKTPAA